MTTQEIQKQIEDAKNVMREAQEKLKAVKNTPEFKAAQAEEKKAKRLEYRHAVYSAHKDVNTILEAGNKDAFQALLAESVKVLKAKKASK